MRSSIFSGVALMASLLARDAVGAPMNKRDYVVDEVVITEVQTVTWEAEGVYKTGGGGPVATVTRHGVTTVIDAPVAASTPVAPVKVASSKPVSSAGGVFAQKPTTTATTAAVETTPAPVVAPAPATTSTAPIVSVPAPVVASVASVAAAVVSVPAAVVVKPTTTAAPVVVSTPSPSSVPVTSGTTGSSGKRGLAYNDPSLLSGFVGSKASWCYNWGSTSGGTVPSSFEYVPMLWGLGSHVNGWATTAQTAIDNGAQHLLSFNEPDLAAQSNILPGDAATGYLANMEQFAGKAKLGAPAVTNGGSPMGITWLKSFLSSCSTCTIDFTVMHWYDSASNFAYFKSYVEDFHAASGGRPIWISEFGASGSVDEQNAFLEQATAYLDGLDYVQRYAYFMVSDGSLVSGGVPSVLGKTFAGL